MSDIKWKVEGSTTSIMTTELNSITTAGGAISGAIDNSSNLDTVADLELLVTYGTNPTAGNTVDVFFARQIDGTNYEDGSSSISPSNGYVGAFPLRAVTTAQRVILPEVRLPPGLFKVVIVNNSGQTTASSGNTLKMLAYRLQVV